MNIVEEQGKGLPRGIYLDRVLGANGDAHGVGLACTSSKNRRFLGADWEATSGIVKIGLRSTSTGLRSFPLERYNVAGERLVHEKPYREVKSHETTGNPLVAGNCVDDG